MSFQDEVYLVADELRSIANAGVFHAGNEYDRERYERALSLSARLVAAIEERPAGDVMEEYRQNLMHVGADGIQARPRRAAGALLRPDAVGSARAPATTGTSPTGPLTGTALCVLAVSPRAHSSVG